MSNLPDRAPMPTVPSPSRIGQGTAVEQSRAAAEVLAAVEVAQRFPRDPAVARAQMIDSCAQYGLAERAFFRFPRADGVVTGPSVHLARELARCWGHIQYGLIELRRDDEYGQSEMQAWAWDVQTNARVSTTFVVPHKRDTKRGVKDLTDLRDIYENNSNHGARRVREMIFAVLPPWFTEEAKQLCQQTLNNGGGKPIVQRVTEAVQGFDRLGVTVEQLERRTGRSKAQWDGHDVAKLGVIFQSLQRGEIRVEDEFPPPTTTAAEILAARAASPPAAAVDPDAEAAAQAAAEGGRAG
ncbi:hypothetical protein [Actinomadura gamaensis]|uniref:Uncharacterized protein n=1 Tax=Actinomadura gamaensis TaxID=1763541 RepID=A0ABV9U9N7_9ACTN